MSASPPSRYLPGTGDTSHRSHARDLVKELGELRANGANVRHPALTGGEPLMHKDEAVAFYRKAAEVYPDAHKRLSALEPASALPGSGPARLTGWRVHVVQSVS